MKTRNTVEPETQSQYENDAERCGVKKYIDLQRDYAFKYAFGREGNEDLLLLLLDSLMPEKHIRSVSIGPQEQIPDREDAKGGIYDINCQTYDDSYFNVEMQVCSQSDFNDRMVHYSSYSIRNYVGKGAQMEIDKELKEGLISKEEAEKKKLSQSFIRYKLPPIYIIGILNFELPGVEPSDSIIRSFSIREDANGTVQFTGSVHYITVELPKFGKSLSQLESRLDYMLYAIKKMGAMTGIPKKYNQLAELVIFLKYQSQPEARNQLLKWVLGI